jgi:hypothetical protein
MNFDIRTHELVAQVVGPDGTLINEIRERETPVELPHHDVFHDERWVYVRKERDLLLSQSDWMVARSAETGEPMAQEWAQYRQALRDITDQRNPFLIVWPEMPIASSGTGNSVQVEEPQSEEL